MVKNNEPKKSLWAQSRRTVMMVIVLLCMGAQTVMAQSSVSKRISIKVTNQPMPTVLTRIERESGYKVTFTYDEIQNYQVTLDAKNQTLESVMSNVVKGTPMSFSIKGRFITVFKGKQNKAPAGKNGKRRVAGYIVDNSGEPVIGASILQGDTHQTVGVSDVNGNFDITIDDNVRSLLVSYIGMDTKMVNISNGEKNYKVVMSTSTRDLNEVVVTGMFNRSKESFTGSAQTYDADQLLSVGNQNLLSSLKNLDPAFHIVENLDMGSNPNAMPNIQMRGETSFNIQGDYDGNANQPLFILDGFETTLENVYDLDMNRIASITLLKDASAKAIYGSKAGNGVVVIETVRPKSGEMRITYNGNLNIEAPDLTGYNLMNAREKFDWEIAHHKYDGIFISAYDENSTQNSDNLYKTVNDAIVSGVDTYWLSKPLRTGIGQKHTLSLEGGDSRVRYLLGMSYNNIAGVMKGSSRNTFNINSTLSYTYKNMVFRNKMDYSRNISKNSPYGEFSEYVKLEPYYAPYDSDGNVKKLLGYQTPATYYPVYNPLYNATLNTKDENNYTSFSDNFDMDWHINNNFRLTARVSYSRNMSGIDNFLPPNHTMFVDYDTAGSGDRKGLYTQTKGESETLSAQAGLNFNKLLGKHAIFTNLTWNLQDYKYKSSTMMAEGFGNDNMDSPSMATYYYHDSHPGGSDSKTREIGLVGAFNYSYDNRYLVDASYRATGSSVYGSDNHWGGFWSTGVGWNVHHERFMKHSPFTLLKLRYSIGYTGTQNFNPYQARAKYRYGGIVYDGALGTSIMGIPNRSLKWQKIMDNNWGVDLSLKRFLTLRFDYYLQNTDNMLVDITLPSSTGFNTYKENMGEIENKGYELTIGITPWRNDKERGWLTFTASAQHNNNKIKKIYDIFKKSNDDADSNLNMTRPASSSAEDVATYLANTTKPATKYYEGCSMTAIWGVRSLGIDPMTGDEIFINKNGELTNQWNSDDQVVIGDTSPKVQGTLGISGGWRGFTLTLVASYKYGGDLYNSTLINRVENVNGYGNLDRRVAETWVNPGDHTRYKKIDMNAYPTSYPSITHPTSRFVQRNNELYLSSVNVGYDFYRMRWLQTIGLERLRLSFYANELARLTNIKVERGLSYPFARTFSFSLNATF